MDALLGLGFLLVCCLVQVCRSRAERDRLRAQWRRAAGNLRLQFNETALGLHLRGTLAGRWLEVTGTTDADSQKITRMRVDLGRKNNLSIAAPTAFLEESRVSTADRKFDAAFAVGGDEAIALAVLDEKQRKAAWSHRSFELQEGIAEWTRGELLEAPMIVSWVHELVGLAQALRVHSRDVPARLAQNARSESQSEVRIRNLQVLFARYAQNSATQPALRAALEDRDPKLRLAAADLLNDRATFLALAANDADPGLRGTLISRLAKDAQHTLWPALDSALFQESPELLVTAIQAAATTRHTAAFTRIAQLARSPDLRLVRAAVDALCTLEPVAAEAVLLDRLKHGGSQARPIAVAALGRVGTAVAVEALLYWASVSWRKEAARSAIRSIQARLSNVEAGRVTLAQALPDGALCLAASQEGVGTPRRSYLGN